MKPAHAIAILMGVPALIWFGLMVGLWPTIALFIILWANNLSQKG